MAAVPSFTVGIEEEYMLVDAETLDLVEIMPKGLMGDCSKILGERVTKEYLQCQIEIGTLVCDTMQRARKELVHYRRTLSQIAERYGCQIMAASTHPFSLIAVQHTIGERYTGLTEQLQAVARRMTISGMHVHIGIDDDDLRIDLMNQAAYTLPHFLALSTSSPFWKGENSGLKSYRTAVFDELPRTGLPEEFAGYSEYMRMVNVLTDCGVIEDASKLWWDIRPSCKFPTLEMRITDICTSIDDAIALASVFRCWLRLLYRLRQKNQRWRIYSRFLISENRWRAARYGIDEALFDFGRGELVEFPSLISEMIEMMEEDAQFFGCVNEVDHIRKIYQRGTSAHHQIEVYNDAISQGQSKEEALREVVRYLIKATQAGF